MNDPDPASADAEAESKTVADANEDSKKANLDSMPLPAPADAEDQSKQDDNVILGLTSAVSSGLAITTAAQEEPDLDTGSNSSMSTTGERPPQMVLPGWKLYARSNQSAGTCGCGEEVGASRRLGAIQEP